MKIVAVLIAFAVALAAAVALFAPATMLDARLDAATQGQLRLANTTGSVWDGRGVVTNAQHTWSIPVSWKVDPLSFVRGDFVIVLQGTLGDDVPRGEIAWRNSTLTMNGVALTLPATAMNGALSAGNAIAVGGTITFLAPNVSWSATGGDGTATARWSGARVAGNAGMVALGTVAVSIAPRNGRVQGRIDNRDGELGIDGEFTSGIAGFDLRATLTPLPSTPPAIVRALGALGTPDANGAVRVQWRSGTR
jgi:general secretion pathway protein N